MAGISGAGLNGQGRPPIAWPPATGGVFSRLARAQYAALAAMRWHAFRNGMRSTRGALEAAVSGLNYLLYAFTGLGMAAGLGASSYFLTTNSHLWALPALLWVVFLVWQTTPVAVASFQQQFDLNGLLRFPLGFRPFFVLHLIFGLVDFSTLLGFLGCLGILAGITLARPGLFVWAALALAVFGVFNILLSRAIFAWFDRWLAQRKTREILSALFLVGVLGLQFLNPVVRNHGDSAPPTAATRAETQHRLADADALQRWFPPGVACLAMDRAAKGHAVEALGSIGLLSFYALAAGFLLAVRLRAEHRGESLSDAPKARKAEKRSTGAPLKASVSLGGSIGGSGPIGAIIEKDLRTVMRSLPLLYMIGAPLLMVIVLASLMGGGHAARQVQMVMPLCVAYALLGFTHLIYNNLGAEGTGIQLLFLSPTPMRTVLLAKNIFHALIFALIALVAGILASLRLGAPDPAWLAATVAWLLFALPAHLAVGNIFSLTMPHRIDLGRIGRQRGAGATGLFGMLVQLAVLGVGAVTVALCLYFDHLELAAPVLLVLTIPALLTWMRSLANADAVANRHRDELIATLAKME
ncbi:MAG: hypothetical protein KGL37_01975 [Acidobacteriota bacterium]|nr:hypothetical protein [Acidobacteriota bacterium]